MHRVADTNSKTFPKENLLVAITPWHEVCRLHLLTAHRFLFFNANCPHPALLGRFRCLFKCKRRSLAVCPFLTRTDANNPGQSEDSSNPVPN